MILKEKTVSMQDLCEAQGYDYSHAKAEVQHILDVLSNKPIGVTCAQIMGVISSVILKIKNEHSVLVSDVIDFFVLNINSMGPQDETKH